MNQAKPSLWLKISSLIQEPLRNIKASSIAIFFLVSLLTAGIIFTMPQFAMERKIYMITALYLAWFLKVLMFDFDGSTSFQQKHPGQQKKFQDLQQRFLGALQFLKKTCTVRSGQSTPLNQLPWLLFISTSHAGKTTLLSHANVNFILQKQFQNDDIKNLTASENCDWWVTRDTTLIDIPTKYVIAPQDAKLRKMQFYPLLWRFFLKLIKKYRGKDGIAGIVIAVPLPEILKQTDDKKYKYELSQLAQRLDDLQKMFSRPIPCHIVITKCDLLPGFVEFFSESPSEEISQAWGVTLPPDMAHEKTQMHFLEQFDLLIKRLNQQLLWRLHQERNPMNRPFIKDFPLQIERLKDVIADLIKKMFTTSSSLALQGVYLTSALQPEPEADNLTIDDTPNQQERSLSLFKDPQASSRTHFVKQFISHSLGSTQEYSTSNHVFSSWKNKVALAVSVTCVLSITLLLASDFKRGIKESYAVQKSLTDYQVTIQQIQNPEERLLKTIQLIESLQPYATPDYFKWDIRHLLHFYSQKAKEKTAIAYHNVLQSIFIPEVLLYLSDYLKTPVNKSADTVYSALETYMMFGDLSHFDVNRISSTLLQIMPKSFSESAMESMQNHLQIALSTQRQPQILNESLILSTQSYLSALPGDQIGYVILKNTFETTPAVEMNMGTENTALSILTSKTIANQMPAMFTAKTLTDIVNNESSKAAYSAINGNWVLGEHPKQINDTAIVTALKQQLDAIYINHYVEAWESLVSNIHLVEPKDLSQTDAMIIHLISRDSPLVQFLSTLQENTSFQLIDSASTKLHALNTLLDNRQQPTQTLGVLLESLNNLHQLLQQLLSSPNEKRFAFDYVTSEVRKSNSNDPLVQLRTAALSAPEPLKTWMNQLANDAWRFILRDAIRYIDISWQTQVVAPYESDIAHHYPFSLSANQEVDVSHFTQFFGNSGILMSYYTSILEPYIDASGVNWQWKDVNSEKLPLSNDVLRAFQQALHINKTFFPDGNDHLYTQYSAQPYKIASSKLIMTNRYLVDPKKGTKNSHLILLNLAQFHLPKKIIH